MAAQVPAAPKVFVSYRRDDSADITGRICDKLVAHFGRDAIFFDDGSIPAGTDFPKVIRDAAQNCQVMLVVIGKKWIYAADEEGQRRLEKPDDYVRLEVEVALKHARRVIPVLVHNTQMPGKQFLPPNIQPLALRDGRSVRTGSDFHGDMERLLTELNAALAQSGTETGDLQANGSQSSPQPIPSIEPLGVRLVFHSPLRYWWPVWLVAGIMFLTTYFSGEQGVYGIIFVTVLLIVIISPNLGNDEVAYFMVVITGIPAIAFACMFQLPTEINATGFLVIGIPLFVVWFIDLWIVPKVSNVLITSKQIRVQEEIGDGTELVVDPHSLIVEVQSGFLFQWVLGFGSGDMIIRTTGAEKREFVFRNVRFAWQKLGMIDKRMRHAAIPIRYESGCLISDDASTAE